MVNGIIPPVRQGCRKWRQVHQACFRSGSTRSGIGALDGAQDPLGFKGVIPEIHLAWLQIQLGLGQVVPWARLLRGIFVQTVFAHGGLQWHRRQIAMEPAGAAIPDEHGLPLSRGLHQIQFGHGSFEVEPGSRSGEMAIVDGRIHPQDGAVALGEVEHVPSVGQAICVCGGIDDDGTDFVFFRSRCDALE